MCATRTPYTLSTSFDSFPLVPCSEFNNLLRINTLKGAIICAREEEAIALGCGLVLSGRRPLVLVQSSGLMASLNTVGSFIVAYGIPLVVAVAMRGGRTELNPAQIPASRAVLPSLCAMGCETHSVPASECIAFLSQIPAERLDVRSYSTPLIALVEFT